jgi:hypothetical protein
MDTGPTFHVVVHIKIRLNAELGHGYQNLAGKIGLTRALNGAPVPPCPDLDFYGIFGDPLEG